MGAGMDTVTVEAITSDPEHTAIEVGKRLYRRLTDGSGDMNPCPMS